jgi:hypothetical protein
MCCLPTVASQDVRAAAVDWMKQTCAQRETLTVAGFALDGTKWDGLYVGGARAIYFRNSKGRSLRGSGASSGT